MIKIQNSALTQQAFQECNDKIDAMDLAPITDAAMDKMIWGAYRQAPRAICIQSGPSSNVQRP